MIDPYVVRTMRDQYQVLIRKQNKEIGTFVFFQSDIAARAYDVAQILNDAFRNGHEAGFDAGLREASGAGKQNNPPASV